MLVQFVQTRLQDHLNIRTRLVAQREEEKKEVSSSKNIEDLLVVGAALLTAAIVGQVVKNTAEAHPDGLR
jgi:hypothetical protein